MPQIDNLQRSNTAEINQFKWNGFYRALVIDAHDERQLGRVKVRIPDIMPEEGAEFCGIWDEAGLWAHPANNYLGGRNIQDTMGVRADFDEAWYQGSCLIPPNGSWVWVFFECGDLNHPYYFGAGDFGQRKVLPENQNGAEWEKKWTLIKSREGRCIVISDDEDDCRVEITGKKRMITNPPDGDLASVFTIKGNQTVILLDERPGHENLLIKDYRGNYIRMQTDNMGWMDQLHIYFQDDIHIETKTNLYLKTGESVHVRVGKDYYRTVKRMTHTFSVGPHHETALDFNRLAFIGDTTTAAAQITEISGAWNSTLCAGLVGESSLWMNQRNCLMEINDTAGERVALEAPLIHELAPMINLGTGSINLAGHVSMITFNVGGAAPPLPTMFPFPIGWIPLPALWAKKAEPDGGRHQDPVPPSAPDPVIATGVYDAPPTFVTTPIVGDPYMKTFEDIPPEPPNEYAATGSLGGGGGRGGGGGGGGGSSGGGGGLGLGVNVGISTAPINVVIHDEGSGSGSDGGSGAGAGGGDSEDGSGAGSGSGGGGGINVDANTKLCVDCLAPMPLSSLICPECQAEQPAAASGGGAGNRCCGLGHVYLLQLKDLYRNKVIPLIDRSYGNCVSFSIFKDPQSTHPTMEYNCDIDYMDPEAVPVYSAYRAEDGVEYNWDIDDTTKWWQNLDEICQQAKQYNMTVIPTLFDFYDSPKCPFVTQINDDPPYNTTWNTVIYGPFLRTVIQHIQESGVPYIINIGYRSYTQSENISEIYPSSNFLKKLIKYLVDECSVSVNEIALTANSTANLFGKCPQVRYKSYFGDVIVGEDQLNIEEYVDSNWGGTGRVQVFNEKKQLIDGYTYFLQKCRGGMPILSTWKMKKFEDKIPEDCDPKNIMNYIFAPNQREAMRIIYGDNPNNDGFVDFTEEEENG